MKILLNNREEDIPGRERITVQELLDHKKFTFKFLVVKVNGNHIPTTQYDTAMIADGDKVLVMHLISGG